MIGTVPDDTQMHGPWNPGIRSQIPRELRHLSTMFRPDNVFTSIAAVTEMQALTGFAPHELVAFRPQRLALHELLIRVTADFAVPDGSRIGDLGINFREIASRLHERYLSPEMDAIAAAYDRTRRELRDAIDAALAEAGPEPAAAAPAKRSTASRLLARIAPRRSAAAIPPATDRVWGPRDIAEYERLAGSVQDSRQKIVYGTACASHVGAVRDPRAARMGNARDRSCPWRPIWRATTTAAMSIGRTIEPLLRDAARSERYRSAAAAGATDRHQHQGPVRFGQEHACGRCRGSWPEHIGVRWSDFALISPDIWRKQLLDYGSLGRLQVRGRLHLGGAADRRSEARSLHGAQTCAAANMAHLLIDRFRFDSFAPDSDEAGSNLLTRFGDYVYLFFVITPPEQLVERAWMRGLEFGRYKAVDDTLAHCCRGLLGMPNVFFTWVHRTDKQHAIRVSG